MNTIWTTWVLLVAGSFIALEGYAYISKGQLLTGWVRMNSEAYPWLPYVLSAMAVVLIVHFWLERYAK